MQIPSNAEIISTEGLDNKVIIPIDRTKFAILGEKQKSKKWSVSIISRLGNAKKMIKRDTTEREFSVIISKTLAHQDQELFKMKITLANLLNHYKLLIKQIKCRH